jgi:hypothetical protein
MKKLSLSIYTNKNKNITSKIKLVTTQETGIYYGGYRLFAGNFSEGKAAAVLSDGLTQIPIIIP